MTGMASRRHVLKSGAAFVGGAVVGGSALLIPSGSPPSSNPDLAAMKARWCPPYCDGGPDGGIQCGGGDNHKPGWPDGVPYEQDVIVGDDGTTLSPSVTRLPNGRMQVSLIIRRDGAEKTVWMSESSSSLFADSAMAVHDLVYDLDGWGGLNLGGVDQ